MNWRVRADFPTPPLPTMMTLWTTDCAGAFLAAILDGVVCDEALTLNPVADGAEVRRR